MKDNPINARKRMKRWRKANLKRHRKVSADWKARNPTWYIAAFKIKSLTTALIRSNRKAQVWKDAGITMDDWKVAMIRSGYCVHLAVELRNGTKLAPFRPWKDFDLGKPSQLRLFLHPDNFTLVKK